MNLVVNSRDAMPLCSENVLQFVQIEDVKQADSPGPWQGELLKDSRCINIEPPQLNPEVLTVVQLDRLECAKA